MTQPSIADAHSQVARFLEHHGYTSTLEMFRREAGSLIPDNSDTLAAHLGNLQLDSPQSKLEGGDFDFYTTLIDRHSDLHQTNILAVSRHHDLVATSGTDKTVKLHQITTQPPTLVHTFRHHQAPVLSIDFHPLYPHLLLTTSMDGTTVLVDTTATTTDNVIQRFKDHQRYVVRGLFSPHTGRYFATTSYDQTLCIYENHGDDIQYELVAKRGPFVGKVETVCFHPDGNSLIVGVQNDNYLHQIPLGNNNSQDKKINLNANGDDWVSFSPTWLSFHPSYPSLLMVSTDHASGRLILLDVENGHQVQNYHIAPASDTDYTTRRHVFHPSGRYFYVIGGDAHHTVKVVETKTGHLEATLDGGHSAMIRAITIGDGALLTVGFDHTMAIWSVASAKDDDLIR
ncbi:WD40-repeat-containing domain protein [Chlamydoabsidia padenii]|nr:WD40-repeat-containing domain protein [Chlamydoabsidia padenii]